MTTRSDLEQDVDRGSVTVETAIGLATLVVVTVACLAALGALMAQLRVSDAAREAARLAGRGDESSAQQAVVDLAPTGATLALSGGGTTVTAVVSVAALGGLVPGMVLYGQAVAAREAVAPP